ncbi:acetate uptake transporter [Streptomyces sp. NPDC002812]|uniref:acetate uptake transporter n=1 Tax=unclassified Streptomyces TaxID=2593676 RepID=UPI00202F1C0F|nr:MULTISPECIES: acetate uptake transporter [unclassified Streptomyces]MCM1967663.1 acetate uptake transporter [Streptomyces sp. G1]MCX5125908.1 acetate uptake transporter [Streptomyces sp. NBC_00347]MCX5298285.1 acetate uptake transporter [Streptomyces sp. NBC_00193]
MDNGVSAGSTASTSTLGHIALGLTLLAFGIGNTGIIDGVTVANSVSLATFLGGLALFVLGILEYRGGNGFNGTAFAGIGAFWFTWANGADGKVSAHAAGLFLVLFAMLALTLTASASGGLFGQGVYGLFTLSLLLLAIGTFAESDGLAKAAGWVAALSGLLAWYGATAALASWPMAFGKGSRGAVAAS